MANRFLSNIRINDAYTFPASDGTNGQILSTDGSGNITFTDPTTADAAKRLEVDVKNVHGATLAKGTVVHAEPTGTLSGNVIEVVAADANSGRMPAIGVLNEALLDDGEGKAVMFGTVQGIDTSGFSVGDELYVSTTAGQFTATKPIATNEEVQKIAIVIKSHASNGLIKVFGAGRANDVPNLLTRNITIDNADFYFGNADQIRMGDSIGLRIQHTGTHSYIDTEIGNMYFRAEANDSDMVFQADDGAGGNINYFYLDGSAATHNGTNTTQTVTVFPDNSKIQLGGDANGDFRLFHNGTNSIIANNTGNIEIINYSDDKDIYLKSDDGSGGTETYYYLDGSLGLNRFLKNTLHNDDVVVKFGTGSDLRIQHSSGNNSSYIQNYTGDLIIENLADDKDIIFKSDDGSGGTTAYLFLDGSNKRMQFNTDFITGDNNKIIFGNSGDLEIYHDGSHSYIKDTGTGDLKLQASNDIFLLDSSGNVMIEASEGGSVDLFYSGSKKLETTSTGIDVTGVTVTDGVTSSAEIDVNLASAGKYFEGGSGNVRRLSITSGTNISAHALHTFDIASSNGKYEFKVNSATKFSLDTSIATFAGNVRLPNSGKLFLWNDHDFNYLMYDRWRASASAGMNIENAAATGSIFLRSGNALTLTLDDSQNATFAGDVTVAGDLVISGTQTILNTQTVEVEDNIIQLNTTQGSPDTATATTSGISIYRGDGVTQASFIFDDADDTWDLTNNLKVAGDITLADNNKIKGTTYSAGFISFESDGETRISANNDVVIGYGETLNISNAGVSTFAGDVTVDSGVLNLTKQNGSPTVNMLRDGTNPTASTLLHHLNFKVDYNGTHQDWGGIEHRTTGSSSVRTQLNFNVKSTSGSVQNALTLEGQPSAVPNAIFAGKVNIQGNPPITANSNFNDLVISDSAHAGISIFSGGTTNHGAIYFGDDDANNVGQIKYLHDTNSMTFSTAAGSASLTLDSGLNATFGGNITLDDGAGASPELIFKNSNDETWKIWHGSQGVLNFEEGTNDRFQLLQGGNAYFHGNVGIGVSPGSQYGLDQNYTVTNPNDDFKFAYRIDANFSGADNTSSDREQGGIYLDIDSSADGDANDEHRLYGIHIDQKYTGFSDQSYGLYSRVETNNITEQTGTLRAVYGFAVADNANVNGGVATMTGGHFDSYLEDMGNINTAHGVFGRTLINSTRTADVESTFGVWGEIQIDSPESINYGDMKAVAAVIDNNEDTVPTFGGQYLYYGAYQGTKGSSAYGVYVTAEDKNYFSNKVGIGTSSPPQKLTVNGAVFITDDLISPGSAGTYTYNGTAIDYSSNGTRYWSWGSGTARGTFNFIQLENDGTNQQTALSINSSGDATFAGGITASSGTGHFSLVNASGYQLNGTYVMDSSRNLVNIAAITASGACTITSGTSVGLTINHDTFENGLVLHRNHASNAASIVFKNNTGLQGTLLAQSSNNQPYWQEGTGTTSYKIWHENNDDDLFKKGADIGGSANLNNYTTPGFYHQNSNSSASSGTNYPANVAGMLTVTSDGVMVYQMYQGYATNHTYERKYYNGTWESWHLIYDSGVFTNNSSNWNTAFNDKINSASFNTGNGVLTLTQQDGGTVTVDLDGRYLTSYTEADTLATVTGRGASTSSAITITNDTYGIFLRTATNGAGSTIRFSDQQPNAAQTGDLTFYHSDSASIGSGASFHFQSTETQLSIVAGDADTTGKFYSYPQADAGEVDFGWANDTDTGMYRPAANQVGLVAGGSRKLLVDSNGVAVQNGSLNVPGGSVGTPSIGVGDTDTGFYDSGSNAIGVSSGGVKTAEFQGGGSFTLVGGAPTISMLDTTSSADDFYLHVNSNNFYVLCDRNGSNTINGGWDSPHPLQLEGDTDIGYLYGHRMFADNYHPNADTWTTSRTITLGGDLTGSVSIDGSANVTLSAQVVNDSHTHDDRYYTESEVQTFFNRGYIDRHHASNLPVGWYTIATNTGDRALGQFQIWETSSSDHMSVLFNASHHFGTDSSNDITVTANSRYSGTNFRYIRIKEGGTYDGAVLQVYVDGATNSCSVAIVGGNAQESGWVLKDWIADGTDPGDVTSYNSMTEKVIVDLDKIVNGGIMTSGEYYATNNRVFHDGYHPNADAWTTGRTISLTGEVTGSVTGVDGSGNVSISTTVSNTALDDQYVDVTGDTMTGNLLGRGVSPTASITYDLGTTSNLYNYTHSRYFQSQGTQARTKVRVWTGTTYGIGMQSGYSFGSLGGTGTGAPEYAQTFQTSNTANRGWWFGDSSHSNAQGAFCVTTTGKGNFAHSLRIGYGETDTTQAGTNGNLDVNGTLHMNGAILMSNFDITEVNKMVFNDPGPTEGIHWSGGNGWQITESPDNMTTNSGGNLQFATGYGGTLVRRVTMTTGGALNATGDVVAYSDRRVKENIETIDNALDKVSKLRGVSYNRTDVEDKSKKIGVIAQEVKEILPEVVHHSEDIDVYSVAYGNMAGLFIESIKELKAEIEELKKQIK